MRDQTNDFAFKIATANGTGSASANSLIMQAIFRMGVPVTGKNLFPSNIQGLPTWYEIRVSHKGYCARTSSFDLMVALNPQTYVQDVAEVRSGGWLLYDSTWPLAEALIRSDITYIGVPLAEMCNAVFGGVRERILMKNICYAGALAALLNLDTDIILELTQEKFAKKPALLESNRKAIDLGFDYVKKHYASPLPIKLERLDMTSEHILIDGNTATALGCLYAGATVGAWYPITPATSVMEAFTGFCNRYRVDSETGEHRFAILQAEDELSAIGMVIGASWAGARSFTPTAGPGISLMSEFIGLAYYAEVPAVIVNVQRTGPSTGMPTRTQQGDLMTCAYASHGDTKHICLYPSDPKEAFEMAVAAFDLAEQFQTPVLLLSDLDIGMNDWMVPKLTWDDNYKPNRGKVLHAEELAEIQKYGRYLDVDGDFIPYRTMPGESARGAYVARGSGHNKMAGYTEDAAEYVEVVDRINKKVQSACSSVPQPFVRLTEGAKIGLVSIGGCHGAMMEAVDALAADGLKVDYMRIRAFPFNRSIKEFLESHDACYIVEQNLTAQLRNMLAIETGEPMDKLKSILSYDGYPLSAPTVVQAVQSAMKVTA